MPMSFEEIAQELRLVRDRRYRFVNDPHDWLVKKLDMLHDELVARVAKEEAEQINHPPHESTEDEEDPITLHEILNDLFAEVRQEQAALSTLDLVDELMKRCPPDLFEGLAEEAAMFQSGDYEIVRKDIYDPTEDEFIIVVPRDIVAELQPEPEAEDQPEQTGAYDNLPSRREILELVTSMFGLYTSYITDEAKRHPHPVVKETLLALEQGFLAATDHVRKTIERNS